ncbi:MAG: glycerate kinase [Candidatus Solincola sediminis]|uniref:Glycerate kinase n=1 Tax=Candidatus Solincola sediminis TaxID=1797199 RepID=A0A1F2WJ80_9ACTN|nr:MAG: glycerate kinase [Candidatus Solincola sediminis]OFW60330.1 MAG: glycerate kinase [Candidatus Solincola sediminis]
MRVLIAPDKFKGSLSSSQAAHAMARGFISGFPDAETIIRPLADGGEGTMDVLVEATGGRKVACEVTGPMGERRQADLGLLGDGKTAVVEMAQASGLELITEDKRDPKWSSTRGTGDLIRCALDEGMREIIVAIGGSATNDGGAGMAQVLGARFLDSEGFDLQAGGGCLRDLDKIDLTGLDPRIKEVRIGVASDVANCLLGDEGASRVFAPQKGAGPEDVELLEAGLSRLSEVTTKYIGRNLEENPGAGAAGGLGFGLMAFLGAEMRPGIEVVMEYTGFEKQMDGCRLVITGEGRLDSQTAYGKTVIGVARAAKRRHIPVVALAGEVTKGAAELHRLGVSCILSITPGPLSLADSKRGAGRLLEDCAREIASLLFQYQ